MPVIFVLNDQLIKIDVLEAFIVLKVLVIVNYVQQGITVPLFLFLLKYAQMVLLV
jgi:hypothetical protein